MNADGSNRTKLSWPAAGPRPEVNTIFSRTLSWSSDGKRIAFTAKGNIYVVPTNGSSTPRRLTTGPEWQCASSLTWSPEGKQIAFTSERGTNPHAIGDPKKPYGMNVSGEGGMNQWRQLTELPEDSAVGEFAPSWAPSGNEIAFATDPKHASNYEKDIHKINVNNLRKTHLTQTPGDENWPTWSPDGRRIAFVRKNGAIYVMNHDGSNPTPVFEAAGLIEMDQPGSRCAWWEASRSPTKLRPARQIPPVLSLKRAPQLRR